jgi:hypothetical protein
LKEEAMQWSAALASRLGQAHAVKSLLDKSNSSFQPTELVSGWSGFLIGLAAHERAEPAAASASPPVAQPSASQPPNGQDSKRAEAPKG